MIAKFFWRLPSAFTLFIFRSVLVLSFSAPPALFCENESNRFIVEIRHSQIRVVEQLSEAYSFRFVLLRINVLSGIAVRLFCVFAAPIFLAASYVSDTAIGFQTHTPHDPPHHAPPRLLGCHVCFISCITHGIHMLHSLNILDTFALQSISLAFLSFGKLTACRMCPMSSRVLDA